MNPRTNRTRRVPHPALIGHALSVLKASGVLCVRSATLTPAPVSATGILDQGAGALIAYESDAKHVRARPPTPPRYYLDAPRPSLPY